MMPNAKVFIGGKYQELGAVKAQNNPQWLRDLLTAEESGSTNATLYSKSSWAYSCINIRADALSGIPWEVRKKAEGEDQGDVVKEDHPLVVALTEVNPEMNWVDLLRALEADLNVKGKGYWLKVYPGNSKKSVVGFQRLNPFAMEVKAGRSGIDHFEFTPKGGTPEKIEREEIIFFRLYDPSNDFGSIPPLEVAESDIRAEAAADEYLADFFSNYAMPAHIINFKDGNIDKNELRRAERRWLDKFRGKGKRHKAQFTSTPEMQVETLGYSIEQLAMGEVREEARRSICGAFRVPMSLAGASEAANYATLHELRKSLYTETIIPRSDYIASVLNAELVEPHFGEDIEFIFRPDMLDVMQPDKKTEAERITLLVNSGTITALAGALEAGYTKDDVGPGPFRGMIAQPEDNPTDGEVAQEEPKEKKSALRVDLEKWCKKSVNRLREGKPALIEFESEHIPFALGMSIAGALETAESQKEVKAIFHSVFDYENEPYTRKRDVDREQYSELKAMIMALAGKQDSGFKVFADNVSVTPEISVKAPNVTVKNVVEVPSVTVENKVAPTPIDVHVEAPTVNVKAPKIDNVINIPKRIGSSERQTMKRGTDKLIKETTTEIVDHYED